MAFLGLGRMGAPMAANVAAAGHDLVVHNRTTSVAEQFAARVGATVADSPRAAADGASVVITMLANEEVVRAVFAGPDGVLAGLGAGAVVVDMGTTGPAGIADLESMVVAAGGVLVDAPVSGSTGAAESASLTAMVGASEEAFAVVEPVLRSMASSVHHLGATGAGSVAKLAVNNVIYALGNALSESLVLAEEAGIERGRIYDVFEDSAIAAPMVGYRRDAFLDPEGTAPAFATTLAQKDLRLITELATELGVPVEQAEANLALMTRVVDDGLGDHDMADVAVHLRRRVQDQGSS
ncbi:NAD(P)-dependent oxidoreductase [Salsipaludibacter albus]|uniref:NAD(P)-dependent oxidoreductase n=1 Tax=Salsipaludibacter albus TaxID=2849650 RepID=UPI003083FD00